MGLQLLRRPPCHWRGLHSGAAGHQCRSDGPVSGAVRRCTAGDAHAVLVLDGAGWHDERALTVPDNLTVVPLPAYSPELNPIERVWLYLRERFLSLRFLPDTAAIIEACCRAWNALTAEPGRIRSLCAYPWITKLAS